MSHVRFIYGRRVWSSVDSQLRVRVTDAALSRDLFPADYDYHHGDGDSESRPTRWMALESLVHRRASSASDMVRITDVKNVFTFFILVMLFTFFNVFFILSTFFILKTLAK